MTENDFLFVLLGASYACFDFAKEFVSDQMPSNFLYDVYLNQSVDDISLTQFDMYPEDEGKIIKNITHREVAKLLYRNEKIPVWIDISVFSTEKEHTVLRLLCAGRYSDDREEWYYQKRGSACFGIKSPDFPPRYKEGQKFSLRKNSI